MAGRQRRWLEPRGASRQERLDPGRDATGNRRQDFSDANLTQEKPAVVLDFKSSDSVSGNQFVVSTDDDRIERAVLATATKHADVRIQIPTMSIDPRLEKIIGIGSIIVISAILFFLIEFVLAVMLAVFLTIFVISAPAGFRDSTAGSLRSPISRNGSRTPRFRAST